MYLCLKRHVFAFNFFFAALMITFILLRLHNIGIINLRYRKNNNDTISKRRTENKKTTIAGYTTPLLKVPWRFQIEEDGFVFPPRKKEEKFITYNRINGSWPKQILQFENANIFAHLLKRTLLVPPLTTYMKKDSTETPINDTAKNVQTMSQIIDFDLLSSMVRLGEINSSQVDEIKMMPKFSVCHDPRLGFWLDYIPSIENIQTWRVLKEQYFAPLKLNLNGANNQYVCPGTKNYMGRWGPPLRVKALYRGILSELSERDEDLIYFEGDTLDTTNIRFFDKQRAKKAQELLLFFVRFSKTITKKTKRLAAILKFGYIAVLANHIADTSGMISFIANEAKRISNPMVSMTMLIVCNSSQQHLFSELTRRGYLVYFAHEFIQNNLKRNEVYWSNDQLHFLSLLLCAYATQFIGFPGTSDLYFVEHLRLQDANMVDGLVTDKVSVRWAKHTMRDRADERKILRKTTTTSTTPKTRLFSNNFTSFNKKEISVVQSQINLPGRKVIKTSVRRKPDKLNNIVCSFCNYIRYVTGKHGCPSMKRMC